jgi:phosphopantetheine adenylyltransferase
MTFSEYLQSKKIDEVSFSTNDSCTFDAWKNLFEQISVSSFTDQKKFKINQIRRKFLLKSEK